MEWFLSSNDASARVLRTGVQGALSALVNYLTIIATGLPDVLALFGVPLLMAFISPLMAELGKKIKEDEAMEACFKVGGTDGD